jgi:hypothetical protein
MPVQKQNLKNELDILPNYRATMKNSRRHAESDVRAETIYGKKEKGCP